LINGEYMENRGMEFHGILMDCPRASSKLIRCGRNRRQNCGICPQDKLNQDHDDHDDDASWDFGRPCFKNERARFFGSSFCLVALFMC